MVDWLCEAKDAEITNLRLRHVVYPMLKMVIVSKSPRSGGVSKQIIINISDRYLS